MWHLGRLGLWLDEGVSIALARMPWRDFADAVWLREANMALYYLLLRAWQPFGDSEAFLRLPSVLLGVGSIAVFMLFTRRLFGTHVALITGILLAASELHVRYTRELRGYGLLIFLVALSWFFWERAWVTARVKFVLAWGAVSALAVYAHFFALFVFAAQLLCLLMSRERWGLFRRLRVAVALYVLMLLPIAAFLSSNEADQISWIHPLDAGWFKLFLIEFFGGGMFNVAAWLLCISFCVWRFLESIRGSTPEVLPYAAAVLGFIVPVAAVALLSLQVPAFVARYLLIAYPCAAVCVAVAIARLRWVGFVLAVVFFALAQAPKIGWLYNEPAWHEYREATGMITSRSRPGDVVAFWGPIGRGAYDFYALKTRTAPKAVFPRDESQFRGSEVIGRPDPLAVIDAFNQAPGVWIVFDVSGAPVHTDYHRFFLNVAARTHTLQRRQAFNGVEVFEYRR